ncbi:MAG TPA: carbohydrate-binding protein [Candidatus Angelobacter sp.]|nr:carbohydrate-binding protein [Candidatus Angelobacter sp.]
MRSKSKAALFITFVVFVTVAVAFAQSVPAWQPNTTYTAGTLVTFNGQEFKCLQSHTSQVGWEPPNVPALWQPVNSGSPDFSVSATPASQSVTAGGSTSFAVSVASLNGFNGTVTLSVAGAPGGATASFSSSSINQSGSSTLNISTLNSVPSGSFTLTVTGTSGSLSHAANVTLTLGGVTKTGATTGKIQFHLLLGVGNAQDSLTLDGDNFTDLIMSNMIAGVMYGHLIQEYAAVPGLQFNKDYLYGSIMAQLLQENIATQEYQSSSNLLDPGSDQQAVMATGQGGPYQINNYAVDLVSGGTAPTGHSLINYIAIQKNIGYTMATASNQFQKPTPPSFNNKFYGPMLPAFFHYNDMVALNVIGKGPGAFTTPWEPQYDQALANFVKLPNSFLDVILNVAYNQGYYGGLVSQYSTRGTTATAATVASVNSYSSIWGNTSTFAQYPYQVHYYLDQMYDNPIPTTGPTTLVTPANHIIFNMSTLENVFSNVFQLLDFSNGSNPAQFFTAAQAQAAFNSALAQHGVASTATLDLSNATQRATIFAVIDSAIGNLETAAGMKFNATTNSQL